MQILQSLIKGQGEAFENRAKKLIDCISSLDEDIFYANINMENILECTDVLLLLERDIKNKNDISFDYHNGRKSFRTNLQPIRILSDTAFGIFWVI